MKKIVRKTSKDHFLGVTSVQWTAIAVFVAVIIAVTGGLINHCSSQHPVSGASSTSSDSDFSKKHESEKVEKNGQRPAQSGSSTPAVKTLKARGLSLDARREKETKTNNMTWKLTDNTTQEVRYREEISESLKDSFSRFNRLVNMKMDKNEIIDKAFNDFFYVRGTNSSGTYQKFKVFMMSLIDREINFKFIDVKEVSSMPEKKLHKIIVEGVYTINEQYHTDQTPFIQVLVSENGNNWKFYGWLENTSN